MVELKQKAPKAATPKPDPWDHDTPNLLEDIHKLQKRQAIHARTTEAQIRLTVLRQRLANLKMNGKTGILQELDAILGVLE